MFSIWHWLVLLLVAVLIFGTKKLRGAGKDIGAAIHDFKEALNGEEEMDKKKDQAATEQSNEDIKKDS